MIISPYVSPKVFLSNIQSNNAVIAPSFVDIDPLVMENKTFQSHQCMQLYLNTGMVLHLKVE
jgi:hypothetical protein